MLMPFLILNKNNSVINQSYVMLKQKIKLSLDN